MHPPRTAPESLMRGVCAPRPPCFNLAGKRVLTSAFFSLVFFCSNRTSPTYAAPARMVRRFLASSFSIALLCFLPFRWSERAALPLCFVPQFPHITFPQLEKLCPSVLRAHSSCGPGCHLGKPLFVTSSASCWAFIAAWLCTLGSPTTLTSVSCLFSGSFATLIAFASVGGLVSP